MRTCCSLKKFIEEKQKKTPLKTINVQYIATPGRGNGVTIIIDDELYCCQAVGEEVAI